MSEDKNHDYQYVEACEARTFEIFREICPNIKYGKRFSDDCGLQFWSCFVAAKIMKIHLKLLLENISLTDLKQPKGKVPLTRLVPLLHVLSIEQ